MIKLQLDMCSLGLLLTPTMDNHPHSVKLICWVLNVSNWSFPVNIDDSQMVGDFKERCWRKSQPHLLPSKSIKLRFARLVPLYFNFHCTTLVNLPWGIHPDNSSSHKWHSQTKVSGGRFVRWDWAIIRCFPWQSRYKDPPHCYTVPTHWYVFTVCSVPINN